MERDNYRRGSGCGRGGGGRGGGGSRGPGGGDHGRHQQQQRYDHHQYQGRGRGRGRGWGRGPSYSSTTEPHTQAQQWVPRKDHGQVGLDRTPPQALGPKTPDFGESSTREIAVSGGGTSGRDWPLAPAPIRSRESPQPNDGPFIPDIESLKISEEPLKKSNLLPVRRPDSGGTHSIQSPKLLVNHFPVKFNPETTIMHYDVDIKEVEEVPSKNRSRKLPKSLLRVIIDKMFSGDPSQLSRIAYDGEKNIFSAVQLDTGKFVVNLSDGEGIKSISYIVTIKSVGELQLGVLNNYLSGELPSIPRHVLQGMELVMKENPSRHRISVGRNYYPRTYSKENDIERGITALKGFQQSLKVTSQDIVLCLDYSILPFRKGLPVLDFLKEHVQGFEVRDFGNFRREVMAALIGLKVRVTHRVTKQNYTITGLTDQNTQSISFDFEDRDGKAPPTRVRLVEYFRDKYDKEIMYKNIACLNLGKSNRKNYVPLEFCVLVEGQRYPKEHLSREGNGFLKNLSLARPNDRMNTICEMVRADDGPCGGNIAQEFGIQVIKNMTKVEGRVIGPPQLKLGDCNGKVKVVSVDHEKRDWKLVGNSFVDGKPVERWALLDFSSCDRFNKLFHDQFIQKFRNRYQKLGIRMEHPLVYLPTDMSAFSDITRLRTLLEIVVAEANKKQKGPLQIIFCVMARKDPGYKRLKWVSEIEVGIVTQCCLSKNANRANDQCLANLAMKINTKLGGSNVELSEPLPSLEGEGHVMFVGADVNHPAARNTTCPSIAAVVATMNWPAANRYATRFWPQSHRTEKIMNFGTKCFDLIQAYAQINKVKPQKIVIFRDGVSEGQFQMVLNEELLDLKAAIYDEHYQPTITLIVAQKRHLTRLFPEGMKDGSSTGNVPPGTVVDTIITHRFEFDFYLNSHYGSLGTSKPTHYHVLCDVNNFTSDQLEKLVYHLCFTFSRCTKPVSLIPAVLYADRAANRGRLFQEVLMEMSPASAASSSSTVSSSSFDEKLYKLRPELENSMFFI